MLEAGAAGGRASQIFDAPMILLFVANVVAFAAATLPDMADIIEQEKRWPAEEPACPWL